MPTGYRKSRTQEIRIVFNFLDETEYLARESEEAAAKAIEAAQNAVIAGWNRGRQREQGGITATGLSRPPPEK